MYVVTDRGGGIALMVAALILLGTWPAIFNLLERRGRLPIHTFLDYVICNYLVAIIFALTLGQIGNSTPEMPNFTTQLSQNNGPSVGFALAGGVFLCIGNIATQYSLAFVGLSVTEVVASSITVVGGTTINYFLDDRINRAEILFPGVGCFLLAAITGAFLHRSNKADQDRKMGIVRSGNFIDQSRERRAEIGNPIPMSPPLGVELPNEDYALKQKHAHDMEQGVEYEPGLKGQEPNIQRSSIANIQATAGTGEYLNKVEDRRAIKSSKATFWKGISITITAGLAYVIFSPAFNLATNDQWHKLDEGVPHLVVYTAFFYFSTSFFFVATVTNLIWLYFPPVGLPKSSIKAYLCDWRGRPWAFLAGILCGLGNGFQFMGGQAAGYAAADSVQALPLVSTFWGVVLFHEYWRSSKKTYILLAAMLALFIAAVGLLMGSAGTRQN